MSDDGPAEPEANVPASENGALAAKYAAADTEARQGGAKTAVARQQRQLQLRPGPPRRLSALRVFLCKSVLYGAFVWARRALNGPKTAVPGPG